MHNTKIRKEHNLKYRGRKYIILNPQMPMATPVSPHTRGSVIEKKSECKEA